MTKIIVNEDACIGCGACMGSASDVFDFNDDGYAVVKDGVNYDELTDEQKDELTDAVDGCPTAAIEVIED